MAWVDIQSFFLFLVIRCTLGLSCSEPTWSHSANTDYSFTLMLQATGPLKVNPTLKVMFSLL